MYLNMHNIFLIFSYISVQEEGLFKLWQGVTPAIYRHVGEYCHIFDDRPTKEGKKNPWQGSQPIREIMENYFTFFQSEKSQGIWEKWLKSGKSQGILIGQYIMSVYQNSQLGSFFTVVRDTCITWFIMLKTAKIGCQIPIMIIMEFWDFMWEKSGKNQGILFSWNARK